MIEPAVQNQTELIGVIAEKGQPAVAAGNDIELVAVDYQQPAAVIALMYHLINQFDIAQHQRGVAPQKLVVIAGDIGYPGAALAHGEDTPQYVGMRLGPVDTLAQSPAVDDIAHQIQLIALDRLEEGRQLVGLASARAQMEIRYPQRPDPLFLRLWQQHRCIHAPASSGSCLHATVRR